MIPDDILVKKLNVLCHGRRMERHTGRRNTAKSESFDLRQHKWNDSVKSRWMHRFIPNIRLYIEREHWEANYLINQFLAGHGGITRAKESKSNAGKELQPAYGTYIFTMSWLSLSREHNRISVNSIQKIACVGAIEALQFYPVSNFISSV